jgi:hypothetical protein
MALAGELVVHRGCDGNAARLGQRLDRRHIHAVAEHGVTIDDNITEIEPDAKRQLLVGRQRRIALGQCGLDFDRRRQRLDDTLEDGQHGIAGSADNATPMPNEPFVDDLSTGYQPGMRAGLVDTHEPTVASDIGMQDRSESSRSAAVGSLMPRPGANQEPSSPVQPRVSSRIIDLQRKRGAGAARRQALGRRSHRTDRCGRVGPVSSLR